MFKNTAGQKWVVFAFDRTDNTPKTGDAAQITANLRLDGGSANATDDTNPTELEDGFYIFDITQAETNADNIVISPASSTSDIQVIGCPAAVYTVVLNDYKADVSGLATAAALTTVDTVVDRIEVDTQDIQAQIGTDGAGLTNLPWNASWDAEVQSECTDALNAYDPPTRTELTSDTNSIITQVNANETKIDAVKAETALIVEDTGTTIPGTITTVDNEIAAIQNDVTDILEDTNELQGDWVNTGRLDTILDSILTDTAEIANLENISAADIWNTASARSDDFGTLLEQLADFHFNDLNIVNSTGIATLRNKANSSDLASWQITDDDTNTTRTDVVW